MYSCGETEMYKERQFQQFAKIYMNHNQIHHTNNDGLKITFNFNLKLGQSEIIYQTFL